MLGRTFDLQVYVNADHSITGTWERLEGVTDFRVFVVDEKEKAMPMGFTYTKETTITSPANLRTERYHRMVVRALNEKGFIIGEAQRTVYVHEVVKDIKVPEPPKNIKATLSGSTVTITFDRVTNANRYDVDFAGKITQVGTNKLVIKTGIVLGNTYSYKVRSKNEKYTGAWSPTYSLEVPEPSPTVKNLKVTATSNAVYFSYMQQANHTYDLVFDGNTYHPTTGARSFTGLRPNTEHSYYMRAIRYLGNGMKRIGTYTPTKKIRTATQNPVGIKSRWVGEKLTITWDKVSGATGYEVIIDGNTIPCNVNSYTNEHADVDKTYSVKIAAWNGYVMSTYSAVTIYPDPNRPKPDSISPPSATEGAINDDGFTVTWPKVDGAEEYELWLRNKNSGEVRETRVSGTSHTYKKLTPDTDYEWKARSITKNGKGAYSQTKTIHTKKKEFSIPDEKVMGEDKPQGPSRVKDAAPKGKFPSTAGDPIDVRTGAFLWDKTLLEYLDNENFSFTLLYDSGRILSPGLLGNKWSFNHMYFLEQVGNRVYFVSPWDEVIEFENVPENGYYSATSKQNKDASIARTRDGKWSAEINGVDFSFDMEMNLLDIVKDGDAVWFEYEGGRLSKITSKGGKEFFFTWQDGKVKTVKDSMENTITFTYTDQQLSSWVDSDGNGMSFTYDADGKMTTMRDGNGTIILENNYDEIGRVVKQAAAEKVSFIVTYDDDNDVVRVKDGSGVTTQYQFDKNGKVEFMFRNNSAISSNTYDFAGRLSSQEDVGRRKTQFFYDEKDRMNKVIHPDKSEESITYDNKGMPIHIVHRDGTEASFQYTNGLVTWSKDENGNTSEYTYDRNGHKLTHKDEEGHIWKYEYDDNGYLKKVVDPERTVVATYQHDKMGRLISYEGEAGKFTNTYTKGGRLKSVTDERGTTEYTYDRNGNVIKVTDRLGRVETFGYDNQNRLNKHTDKCGNTTKYEYDSHGNLIQVVDAKNKKESFFYTSNDLCSTHRDRNGNQTSFYYDKYGRLIEKKLPDNCSISYDYDNADNIIRVGRPNMQVDQYTYDAEGRVKTHKNAKNETEKFEYDAIGNLIRKEAFDGKVTEYTYDKMGHLTKVVDGSGERAFTYDACGRIIKETDQVGQEESLTYDEKGKIASFTDKEGNHTRFSYDSAGRLLKEETISAADAQKLKKDPDAKVDSTTEQLLTYNAVDEVLSSTNAIGEKTAYTYDAEGRVTSVKDGDGSVTKYTYDACGNLVEEEDACGAKTTYTYDGNGNVLTRTDAMGSQVTYTYDPMNRPTSVTDELGNMSTMEYDYNGNLLCYKDAKKHSWTYLHNVKNELTKVCGPEDMVVSYEYTPSGKLKKMTDPEGAVTEYEYDAADNVVKIKDALGNEVSFERDALGRITKCINEVGDYTEYEYSPNGNILEEKDSAFNHRFFTYDSKGRLLTEEDVNHNVIKSYTYDAIGQVTSMKDAFGGVTRFTYNAKGQIRTVVDAEDHVTTYQYDACGHLIKVIDAEGNEYRFTVDLLGRRVRECFVDHVDLENGIEDEKLIEKMITLYEYDKKSQMIKETHPDGNTKEIAYDAVGNIDYVIDEEGKKTYYVYDGLKQLTGIVFSNGGAEGFFYNKRGELVRYAGHEWDTTFEYDLLGNLTKATEKDGTSVSYKYDAAKRLSEITYPDTSVVKYEYNAFGKVSKVIDGDDADSRNITDITYDVHGNVKKIQSGFGAYKAFQYGPGGVMNEVADGLTGRILEGHAKYFTRNKLGQITSVRHAFGNPGDEEVESYTYDKLGRLTEILKASTLTQDKVKTLYHYDGLGNRLSEKSYVNDVLQKTINYSYDTFGKLVSKGEGNRKELYEYDKCGNLIQESLFEKKDFGDTVTVPVRFYTYGCRGFIESCMNQLTGETSRYVQDNLGILRSKNVDGENFKYLPDYLQSMKGEVDKTAGRPLQTILPSGKVMRHLYAGDERLVKWITDPKNNTLQRVSCMTDFYGSSCMFGSAYGNLIAGSEFDIWGKERDFRYTGTYELDGFEQEALSELKCFAGYTYDPVMEKYFAGARVYDQNLGRFLGYDPVRTSFNRYTYCENDPVNLVDPTGELFKEAGAGALVGGMIGGGKELIHQLGNGDFKPKDIAWSSLEGAIRGAETVALLDPTLNKVSRSAVRAILDGALNAAQQERYNHYVDWSEVAKVAVESGLDQLALGEGYFKDIKSAFKRGALAGALGGAVDYVWDVFDGMLKEQSKQTHKNAPASPVPVSVGGTYRPSSTACVGGSPVPACLQFPDRKGGYAKSATTISGNQDSDFNLAEFGKRVAGRAIEEAVFAGGSTVADRAIHMIDKSIVRFNSIKYKHGYFDYKTRIYETYPNGERVASMKDIRKLRKKVGRFGIGVRIDRLGNILPPKVDGAFDYLNEEVVLPINPKVITLAHEGFHVEQYVYIGAEAYRRLEKLEREEYVHRRLLQNKNKFNEVEIKHQIAYINSLRSRYNV